MPDWARELLVFFGLVSIIVVGVTMGAEASIHHWWPFTLLIGH